MFRRKKRKIQTDTAFIIAGAAVGGIIGLLYAPKSGKELRGNIKNEADNLVHQVKKIAADMKDDAISTADDLITRAGKVLNLSREYAGGSYQSTAGLILNEIDSIRRAFNTAVYTYKNYRQESPAPRKRVNNVFATTEIDFSDEALPKYEGMGRRQE